MGKNKRRQTLIVCPPDWPLSSRTTVSRSLLISMIFGPSELEREGLPKCNWLSSKGHKRECLGGPKVANRKK